MSQPEFNLSEADLDRLADYTAGLLEGPDAAEVAALVATDPGWSRAHAALVVADAAISGQLRTEGNRPAEPMPADVVARIDAALRPTDNVISLAAVRSRSRRRHQRALTGVAAGVAAAVALVVGINLVGGISAEQASPSAGDAAVPAYSRESPEFGASGPPGNPLTAADSPRIVASGTQYGAASLAALARATMLSGNTSVEPLPSPVQGPGKETTADLGYSVPDTVAAKAPTLLLRLTEPAALRDCLSAILVRHPGVVRAVDFASYLGSPALVVLVRLAAGGSVAVAAGPDCGITGADERASAPV